MELRERRMGVGAWRKRWRATLSKFRFQDMEIWKNAIGIAGQVFDIADALEERKLFRFSEQLRGSAMSISNNIAEGSGSGSIALFKRFLDIARGSAFETANIIMLLQSRGLIVVESADGLLNDLEFLCRKITAFKRTL